MFRLSYRWRTKMFAVLVTGALALTGSVPGSVVPTDPDVDVSVDVVGGHAASESYPAVISLQVLAENNNTLRHFCGASLISRRWAVTTAHCVTAQDGSVVPGIILRIGSPDRTIGAEYIGADGVVPHPDWDWGAGTDRVADIALIRLNAYTQSPPIEIAPRPQRGSAAARLVGWGSTGAVGGGDAPILLQELDTRLVPNSRCAAGGISDGEICVNNVYGADGVCYGDSGGLAMQRIQGRWQLTGASSRGTTASCGTGPAIVTNPACYRDWLYEVMRTGTVPPPVHSNPPPAWVAPGTAKAPGKNWYGLAA